MRRQLLVMSLYMLMLYSCVDSNTFNCAESAFYQAVCQCQSLDAALVSSEMFNNKIHPMVVSVYLSACLCL